MQWKILSEALTCLEEDDLSRFHDCLEREPDLAERAFEVRGHGVLEPLSRSCPDEEPEEDHRFAELRPRPITLLAEVLGSPSVSVATKASATSCLLAAGADPRRPAAIGPRCAFDLYRTTPLAIALVSDLRDCVTRLLRAGASLDQVYPVVDYDYFMEERRLDKKYRGHERRSAAGRLALLGYLDSVGFRFDRYERVRSCSLLEHAVRCLAEESLDVMELLLKRGVQPDALGERGRTAFARALEMRRYRTAELLLQHGADVDAGAIVRRDRSKVGARSGDAPIHLAIRRGDRAMAEALVKYGARLDTRNDDGEGPLDLAREQKRFKGVVKLLERAGAAAYRSPNAPKARTRAQLLALIEPDEPWADRARASLEKIDEDRVRPWYELLSHCAGLDKPTPDPKWRERTGALIEDAGRAEVRAAWLDWLERVDRRRTSTEVDRKQFSTQVYADVHRCTDRYTELMISANNTRLLVGMLRATDRIADEPMVSALASVAKAMYRKVPNVGIRNAKIANAAAGALVDLGVTGLRRLVELERLTSYGAALAHIVRVRERAEKTLGITAGELERLSVPDLPLDEDGACCPASYRKRDRRARLSDDRCRAGSLVEG